MPYADDPNGVTGNAIEKSVRGNDDLAVKEVGKLRKDTTGVGKPFQPA